MKFIALPLFLYLVLFHMGVGQFMTRRGPPPIEFIKSTRDPQNNTIEQLVDNFNPLDDRTWSMRYISNDDFFAPGSPMYVFVGGEWEIDSSYVLGGQMYDMAYNNNGMLYYTEHRYYGESQPFDNLTTENLKYLRTDQSLADVAHFIKDRKANVAGLEDSKVVIVGGSYSATMVTWLRLKYPDLVDVAYASSAPLLAIEDFYQYYEVVSNNIKLNSEECASILEKGMVEVLQYLPSPSGLETISAAFNTCDTVQNIKPYNSYFMSNIINVFGGLVQYAKPGQILQACSKIIAATGTPMEKLGTYIVSQSNEECMVDYDNFLQSYTDTDIQSDTYRQWAYQSCTEFGFWQTASSSDQIFGDVLDVEYFRQMCIDLYGEELTAEVTQQGIKRTNDLYGALSINVTHLMSVHGTVDPWHSIGILWDLNELAPTVLVNGTSHCADLDSISDTDLPQLKAAKQKAQDEIQKWIS